MRAAFRIGVYLEDAKLSKDFFKDKKDPLYIGIRYILEFKYLEAAKWLQVAKASYEKYLLLYLIAKALKQENLEMEYFGSWEGKTKVTPFEFYVEIPDRGLKIKADAFLSEGLNR